jgi:hypothetical protein
MDIYNKFSKKANDTAQEAAQKLAKVAREETTEFVKSASGQVTGNENQSVNNQPSPIVEAMHQGTQHVGDVEHEGIHQDEKKRLDYLEKELEELKRQKRLEEEQKQAMQEKAREQQVKPPLPLVEPTSKRKRGGGRMTFLQKKQRKTEIGRSAKG